MVIKVVTFWSLMFIHFPECIASEGDNSTVSQYDECSKFVDLVVLIESSNITQFSNGEDQTWHPAISLFLEGLFHSLRIDQDDFRVAVILYSASIDDVMTFTVDRDFALHGISFLRPKFGNSNLHTGLIEMNKMFQYYSRPRAVRRALIVSGSHVSYSTEILAEVWKSKILNIDMLAVGYGPSVNENEMRQIAAGFVITIDDIGMLYALVKRIAKRICIQAVDGEWSQWMAWSPCSVSCNGGYRTRMRTCNNPEPLYGGSQCENSPQETFICNDGPCDVVKYQSEWSTWGDCSTSCGIGQEVRSRVCSTADDIGCNNLGIETNTRECFKAVCPHPVDGKWSEWTAWSSCDCRTETSSRTRSCSNPSPRNGGKGCEGYDVVVEACDISRNSNCVVDGTWSDWSAWSTCSVTCGSGTMHRFRSCDNPSPKNGGVDCSGVTQETLACDSQTVCEECMALSSNFGPQWYDLHMFGAWIPQRCHGHLIFSQPLCGCVEPGYSFKLFRDCELMFHLDFHSSKEDKNVDKRFRARDTLFNHIDYDSFGNGLFKENSNAILWQFYSIRWRSNIDIAARVRPELPVTSFMTILSDGDCSAFDIKPSIVIALEAGENEKSVRVLFGISLEKKENMVFINVTTEIKDFIEVHLHFKGTRFGGEVNGKLTEITFEKPETVKRYPGPLAIGKSLCANDLPGFRGLIGEVNFFKC